MAIRSLLPSPQFVLIVISIAASAGLVFAADYFTNTKERSRAQLAITSSAQNAETEDWRAALEEVQALSGATLPPPPSEDDYQALLEAAQSANVTESTARTLFIDLSYAGAQGLGSDIPTQEQVVARAFQQLPENTAAHGLGDLLIVPDTKESLRAYGDSAMTILQSHREADAGEVLRALGAAVDNDDSTYFKKLDPIQQAYRAIADGLLVIPVPQTLSPLHLVVVNNFYAMTAALADMKTTPTDPLRGLVGLQRYQLLLDETGRVFTTIAQQLQQNAILFTEDEPGNAWSAFLPVSP